MARSNHRKVRSANVVEHCRQSNGSLAHLLISDSARIEALMLRSSNDEARRHGGFDESGISSRVAASAGAEEDNPARVARRIHDHTSIVRQAAARTWQPYMFR
ncbi:hypothetical protein [Streptomyces sp. OK228]|uniref:hypothetical protein n=1 Tax=Streptomyces sp. OK228 TaxID=1882786 RepID=UPI00117E616F|nr:hypothetical protein [Streptomyces sp. OK228]